MYVSLPGINRVSHSESSHKSINSYSDPSEFSTEGHGCIYLSNHLVSKSGKSSEKRVMSTLVDETSKHVRALHLQTRTLR